MISPSSGSMSFSWEVVVLYDLTFHVKHNPRCFQSQGEGAADLLEVLGHAHDLGFVDFQACPQIPAAAWSSRIPVAPGRSLRTPMGIPQEEVLRIRARTALD